MHSTGCQGAVPSPGPATGHANSATPRLDIGQLEDNVSFFLSQALAPSTLRSYKSGQKRFLQFCCDAAIKPWPLTERVLCMFVAQLGKESLTHQTIKCYLSAVRFLSISTGQGDQFSPGAMPVLQYVLRGIKRVPKPPTRTRLPITPAILRALKTQWAQHARDVNYVMLWAACCVGFFGFLRAGEFTVKNAADFDTSSSLRLENIAVDQHENPSVIRIRSKTEPFWHGVDIFLGRTKADLCPVAALLTLVAVRPSVAGPLFAFEDGSFSRDKLVSAVQSALRQAGIEANNYKGHRFRIGAATTAAEVGLEDSMVKMLGRWESSAYQRYIRTPRETLAALSARLVQAPL